MMNSKFSVLSNNRAGNLEFIAIYPSLKHIVSLKYPSIGLTIDGFMTLNKVNFTKQYPDGSE